VTHKAPLDDGAAEETGSSTRSSGEQYHAHEIGE
jgi:hypothetical protein